MIGGTAHGIRRWHRRAVEWSVVLVLAGSLALTMAQQIQWAQGFAERAMVRSTLGSLRTAFALDHVVQAARAGKSRRPLVLERNPFLLLAQLPVSYAGVHTMQQAATLPPGSWVFDVECGCVGYVLRAPHWLDQAPDGPALWFQVVGGGRESWQLVALMPYRSQGQSID